MGAAGPARGVHAERAMPSNPSTSSAEPDPQRPTVRTRARPISMGDTRPTLTVVTGADAGRTVPVPSQPFVIGCAPDADFRRDDPGVSRKHARVSRAPDGAFRVEDLGSTNGTFVRGRRVTSAELLSGDHLQLGPTLVLRFALLDDLDASVQAKLFEASVRDALTGAFNRRYLTSRLNGDVAHARRSHEALSVLMIDVDHFRRFNEACGHIAADRVLSLTVDRAMRHVRAEDVLARYGGDEFVLLARRTPHAAAVALADRLRLDIGELRFSHVPGFITVSIGVASLE